MCTVAEKGKVPDSDNNPFIEHWAKRHIHTGLDYLIHTCVQNGTEQKCERLDPRKVEPYLDSYNNSQDFVVNLHLFLLCFGVYS